MEFAGFSECSKPWSLAALLLLSGCGGAGNETNTTSAPSAPAQPAGERTAATADQPQGKSVTPERVVDAKGLSKVVEEETAKGGEAMEGPSPTDYLWQFADEKLIKEEPLTVNVPRGLQPLMAYVPTANPLTKGKVELGKQLYFDARIALDTTVSCATCHNPAKGWTDQMPVSIGIGGQTGDRSAPTVLNTVYGRTLFWDGRSPLAGGPVAGTAPEPDRDGQANLQADRQAAPGDLPG